MVENKKTARGGNKKKVMGTLFVMKKSEFEIKIKDLPSTAWFCYRKGM